MESEFVDMLIANSARDAERHVKQVKFLEQEIKTMVSAIRSATDLDSLRITANECVERLRKHSLEEERERLRHIAGGKS